MRKTFVHECNARNRSRIAQRQIRLEHVLRATRRRRHQRGVTRQRRLRTRDETPTRRRAVARRRGEK